MAQFHGCDFATPPGEIIVIKAATTTELHFASEYRALNRPPAIVSAIDRSKLAVHLPL